MEEQKKPHSEERRIQKAAARALLPEAERRHAEERVQEIKNRKREKAEARREAKRRRKEEASEEEASVGKPWTTQGVFPNFKKADATRKAILSDGPGESLVRQCKIHKLAKGFVVKVR